MSAFIEYLKLVPEAINNIPEIAEGIVNSVKMAFNNLSEDKKNEIIKRRLICEGCPFMSTNATTSSEYKQLIGESYKTDRKDKHCTFCGCPLETRTSSLHKDCGIASWNKNHPDKQQPLKWEAYGKS